jgi:transglutaminase-like putative cysteine protease
LAAVAAGCSLLLPNRAPVARLTAIERGEYVPLTVVLDARDSYDPDGRITVYRWSVGDELIAEGATVVHTFTEPGRHTVELEVIDDEGAAASIGASFDAVSPPSGYLARHYRWSYGGEAQQWDILIPEAVYDDYTSRQTSFADRYRYELYVEDGLDEPTLRAFARELLVRVDGDEIAFLRLALSFVQGAIEYEADPPGLEQPRYPLETMVDGRGDCEDAAILYVNLINTVGADASLAFIDTNGDRLPDHLAALVPVPSLFSGDVVCHSGTRETLMVFDGELMAYAEASVDVPITGYITLGCDPWGLSESDIIERWTFGDP